MCEHFILRDVHLFNLLCLAHRCSLGHYWVRDAALQKEFGTDCSVQTTCSALLVFQPLFLNTALHSAVASPAEGVLG